jgi:hypothetical protein
MPGCASDLERWHSAETVCGCDIVKLPGGLLGVIVPNA